MRPTNQILFTTGPNPPRMKLPIGYTPSPITPVPPPSKAGTDRISRIPPRVALGGHPIYQHPFDPGSPFWGRNER